MKSHKPKPCTCRLANWQQDKDLLQSVRQDVFINEQGISARLEWDERDKSAIHTLAQDGNGQAIATGRLLPEGRIGRMAILSGWRGKGIGKQILNLQL
ncbi:hypothetical protein BMS3Bbin11_01219 [bacterium BMS3Bbin11]|nr:hypothetical protein BMS3Abin11_02282 [bacterium BMS3Abin11]GBE46124.1 hypothetical protein BMS3Bbin11_01219 [bacterium BMS3Bbin11]GMT41056.1 MAG: hypothetical protein IEMM0001_1791 [bacterium]HDH07985.1 hypothetical protein [Gammaproteobacteria bacterium]HDH14895.1 hypothetical protein [Gammaproteobacteria bacterium]